MGEKRRAAVRSCSSTITHRGGRSVGGTMLVDANTNYPELHSSPRGSAGAGVLQGPPVAQVPRRRPARWSRRYRAVLVTADCVIAVVAAVVMLWLRPGQVQSMSPYALLCLALPVIWPLTLATKGAYLPKHYGTGSEEFRKVARSGLMLLAGVSVVSYGGQMEIARSLVVCAVRAMTVVSLFTSFSAGKWLHWA